MSEIKIESGIPIPNTGKWVMLFKKAKHGDSFFLESANSRAAICIAAKRLGMKVISRKEGSGFRFWILKEQSTADSGLEE